MAPGSIFSNIISVMIVIAIVIISLNINTIKKHWDRIFDYNLLTICIMYVVPLAGIIGITAPLLFGMYNFTMLGLYLALPMIIASAIYWLYFYRAKSDGTEKNEGV